jgi:hypothetical protein
MDFKTAQTIATQAYIKAWRECGMKFCQPVGVSTRDKHWSKRLREAWPECTTVTVKEKTSEMMPWCNEHNGSFWHNGGGDKWYFENHDTALLFKLTFGGAI